MASKTDQRKWRREAASALGFNNMAELAKASGINDGDICKIYKGKISLSDKNAHKLVKAVIQRQGWTYLEAALQLVGALNYLRNHIAHCQGRQVKQIEDTDAERWHLSHLEEMSRAIADFDDSLNLIRICPSTEENLNSLLKFLRYWETKHDFGYLDKVKQKFHQNKRLIYFVIQRGMEDGFYLHIKDIYTEIRHIAHLCEEFELVTEMSNWLIEKSSNNQDIQTEVKAKVTLAWTFTSARQNLYAAQQLVKELYQIVNNAEFLKNLSSEDIDVIAILCELRLRLAVRLDEQMICPLEEAEFSQLKCESIEMFNKISNFQSLSPRLKIRYKLPLDYQEGIYLYRLQQYEKSREKFSFISEQSDCIGWIRVQQAAYSWLATIMFQTVGPGEELNRVLAKINVPYLFKRQQIRERILSQISE